MESGQRRGKDGKKIPRQIINKFTAAFNGNVFFEADWYPAISANPYQSFHYKAKETGEFTFSWKDDNGETYTAKRKMAVA
jgi:sulfur-oxidizing protein SoxZ